MANLMVTTACTMRCPFCFAGPATGERNENSSPHIRLENFEEHLAFLSRSGIAQVRLIGGEPTLHPRFPELIERARGRHIVVFTGGLIPERSLTCLEELAESECTVIVNMNATRHPDGPSHNETRRRSAVVKRLQGRALLGFTISHVDFVLEPILDLIAATGARREIRLGLAQPVLGGSNKYLHPKLYASVGRRLTEFALRAAAEHVRLEFDCGFVRCMFSEEDLAALKAIGTDVGWRCNPVLDVGVDGTVSHCFPLAGHIDLQLFPHHDAGQLRGALEAKTRPYRQAGIYPACSGCEFKHEGECTGGCLALTMSRFRDRTVGVGL